MIVFLVRKVHNLVSFNCEHFANQITVFAERNVVFTDIEKHPRTGKYYLTSLDLDKFQR